jgi:hypothetical protein
VILRAKRLSSLSSRSPLRWDAMYETAFSRRIRPTNFTAPCPDFQGVRSSGVVRDSTNAYQRLLLAALSDPAHTARAGQRQYRQLSQLWLLHCRGKSSTQCPPRPRSLTLRIFMLRRQFSEACCTRRGSRPPEHSPLHTRKRPLSRQYHLNYGFRNPSR